MVDDIRTAAVAIDGTAFGQVADSPANGDFPADTAPAVFDETTGFVKKMEQAMSPEAILDMRSKDDPEAVPSDIVERLLPGFRDVKKRGHALELYIGGEMSIHDIAEKVGVPDRTVAKWAAVGNWIRFQQEIADTLKQHERVRLAALRSKHREKAIKSQIALGESIVESAKVFVDGAETAGQFKMAAEGAKLGSDMVGRALAISESGKVDADEKTDEKPAAQISLVNVFKTGGIPTVESRGETIDVQSETK